MTLGASSAFMCNVALRMSTQPQVPTKNRNNNTKQATKKKKKIISKLSRQTWKNQFTNQLGIKYMKSSWCAVRAFVQSSSPWCLRWRRDFISLPKECGSPEHIRFKYQSYRIYAAHSSETHHPSANVSRLLFCTSRSSLVAMHLLVRPQCADRQTQSCGHLIAWTLIRY